MIDNINIIIKGLIELFWILFKSILGVRRLSRVHIVNRNNELFDTQSVIQQGVFFLV